MSIGDIAISNAAGTVKTVQDLDRILKAPVTHAVVGSITVKHRTGNPLPNFWVSPDGSYALNSLGLPNPGIEYYAEMLPAMCKKAHRNEQFLYANICGLEPGEWAALTGMCLTSGVDGIEVNLACPNVWVGGERKKITAFDPKAVSAVLHEVFSVFDRARTKARLAIKLSPYWMLPPLERADLIGELCALIKVFDIDELVLSNTEPDFKTPSKDGKPVISMPAGGRSGSVLLEKNVKQVNAFYSQLPNTVFITGVGGISGGADIQKYHGVGASGVQVGTEFYLHGEHAISRIVQEYAQLID